MAEKNQPEVQEENPKVQEDTIGDIVEFQGDQIAIFAKELFGTSDLDEVRQIIAKDLTYKVTISLSNYRVEVDLFPPTIARLESAGVETGRYYSGLINNTAAWIKKMEVQSGNSKEVISELQDIITKLRNLPIPIVTTLSNKVLQFSIILEWLAGRSNSEG